MNQTIVMESINLVSLYIQIGGLTGLPCCANRHRFVLVEKPAHQFFAIEPWRRILPIGNKLVGIRKAGPSWRTARMLRGCVSWKHIWRILIWRVPRLPGRWPDGGWRSTVAWWTRWRATPAYAHIPVFTWSHKPGIEASWCLALMHHFLQCNISTKTFFQAIRIPSQGRCGDALLRHILGSYLSSLFTLLN